MDKILRRYTALFLLYSSIILGPGYSGAAFQANPQMQARFSNSRQSRSESPGGSPVTALGEKLGPPPPSNANYNVMIGWLEKAIVRRLFY